MHSAIWKAVRRKSDIDFGALEGMELFVKVKLNSLAGDSMYAAFVPRIGHVARMLN